MAGQKLLSLSAFALQHASLTTSKLSGPRSQLSVHPTVGEYNLASASALLKRAERAVALLASISSSAIIGTELKPTSWSHESRTA